MARNTSGGHHRSAITGRYVTGATAARHPRTTVTTSGPGSSGSTAHRSAITGRYVTGAASLSAPSVR